MQEGRFSTIRFNEWICLTAQYEKAVARLGRQVYQGFSRGLIVDLPALELCKEISETFAEARSIRLELEEELERDVLDGLNVEETKIADQHRNLTQAQKTTRTLKLRVAQLLGRHGINRKLAAHRDRVRELSRDLGLRALACYQDRPILNIKGHKALCRLADQLNEDADKKWEEIVASNKQNGGGLSFHTILLNFIGNFANFSKGTPIGKMLLKYFKYDESAENSKLSKAYEGSATADTLRAQLEEIEEPHLDVGREIDNMQQEYEETPVEWNLPSSGHSGTPGSSDYASKDYPTAPSAETWKPEADEWSPTDSDDDFLDAVADVPGQGLSPTPPQDFTPPSSSGPTLLRRRPEPEAESWGDSASKARSVPAPPPKPASDNWGWGEANEEDSWSTPSDPSPPQVPGIGQFSGFSDSPAEEDPFDFGGAEQTSRQPRPKSPTLEPMLGHPPAEASSFPAPPSAPREPSAPVSKPPFVKPEPKERPLGGDWSSAPKQPSGPSSGWGDEEFDSGYGWGTPAPPSPPSQPPFTQNPKPTKPEPVAQSPTPPAPPKRETVAQAPLMSSPPQPPATPVEQSRSSSGEDSDPLLELLRNQPEDVVSPPPPKTEDSLGDDLLPDFLKDRMDEETGADDAFIPELPSFLAGEGPQLEIVPFGSKEGYQPVTPEDDDEDKPFIPQMPDL